MAFREIGSGSLVDILKQAINSESNVLCDAPHQINRYYLVLAIFDELTGLTVYVLFLST